MKQIIAIVMAGLFVCSSLIAQESIEKTPASREHLLSQSSINDLEATEWSRYVYRVLNNSTDANSPLFNPVRSSGAQTNLFSLIFNLLKENKISAYRFDIQNSDLEEKISLKDVLDIYSIPYTSNGTSLFVHEHDTPTNEVVSFYVKEKWYFDSKTGLGGTKVVAVCPVMHRQENLEVKDGPVAKNPLFWISIDDLRPYLLRVQVPLNSIGDLGKARNASLYDYFANRNYKGDIYQVGNRNLYQFFSKPEDLAAEQTRLEQQLNKVSSRFKLLHQ